MYPGTYWQRRRNRILVVAPAGATTWAVAFSRRLIPGALFTSKTAAIAYAFLLAAAAGLNDSSIRILGST
jgi:hypothetical protein